MPFNSTTAAKQRWALRFPWKQHAGLKRPTKSTLFFMSTPLAQKAPCVMNEGQTSNGLVFDSKEGSLRGKKKKNTHTQVAGFIKNGYRESRWMYSASLKLYTLKRRKRKETKPRQFGINCDLLGSLGVELQTIDERSDLYLRSFVLVSMLARNILVRGGWHKEMGS